MKIEQEQEPLEVLKWALMSVPVTMNQNDYEADPQTIKYLLLFYFPDTVLWGVKLLSTLSDVIINSKSAHRHERIFLSCSRANKDLPKAFRIIAHKILKSANNKTIRSLKLR